MNFEIEGLKCADCFSGSGALGIEAISRGAQSVTFVEKTPKFAASIEANLGRLNISEKCKIEIKNIQTGQAGMWKMQNRNQKYPNGTSRNMKNAK